MMSPFTDRIAELCDAAVTAMSPVSGGDFATAFCVDLDDGRRVFAKTHTNPPPGFSQPRLLGWPGSVKLGHSQSLPWSLLPMTPQRV